MVSCILCTCRTSLFIPRYMPYTPAHTIMLGTRKDNLPCLTDHSQPSACYPAGSLSWQKRDVYVSQKRYRSARKVGVPFAKNKGSQSYLLYLSRNWSMQGTLEIALPTPVAKRRVAPNLRSCFSGKRVVLHLRDVGGMMLTKQERACKMSIGAFTAHFICTSCSFRKGSRYTSL